MIELSDFHRLRDFIEDKFGLNFDDTKRAFLEDVLNRRCGGAPTNAYLARLENSPSSEQEIQSLADELTVSETYFFRHTEQLHAFIDVMPDRLSTSHSAQSRVRILSAGCASGEEPYSLAILFRERFPEMSPEAISIRAVDLNSSMIGKALQGRYSSWSLRQTSAEIQSRWFREDGKQFNIDPGIRSMVAFEKRNLAEKESDLWQPGTYDAVFCRNLIMYMTPGAVVALIEKITKSLKPGGYFFLGHAETLRGLTHDFHLRQSQGAFFYQRKEPFSESPSPGAPQACLGASPELPGSEGTAAGTNLSWIDTIRSAAERIEALTREASNGANPAITGNPARGNNARMWNLAPVFEMLRQERFSEALALVGALPPESATDPDVLLLRASLLMHKGQVSEAEKACSELLVLDELNAGAHYLMALCRESAGEIRAAMDHDLAAVHLDANFAMPRLHMGLMARRAGDIISAHRELSQAVMMLQREEPSRLILFGGGFNREVLVGICQAELAKCGGH